MKDTNAVVTQNAPTNTIPEQAAPAPKKRGFAAMSREQVRELARRGGAAAHLAGTAHEFSSDEARAAGRKGGLASHAKNAPPAANPVANPSSTESN
jgi:general stress protein YciG